MDESDLGTRTELALVKLIQRDTRAHLYERALAPFSDIVDAVRYPTLSGIFWYGPLSAAALSERVGVDRTVASRYAAQLENAGLVQRAPDARDARASLLTLTDEGRTVVAGIRLELANVIKSTFDDWPPGLAESFVEGLERFVAAAPTRTSAAKPKRG
ncbi:transcriptional regulator [Rhodococcus sp. 05-339-2]|uniref:MarR family winged helix-turn-helix transcriptional regulator n=1 Tax=Rhodococcoides fascians TaxID=1828 RepID=UPI00068F50A8|nr:MULTISPECIES: MarR family transcriptional regulator [Rhodococcus]OZD79444.1 transcriptional regulator [Rhodococcus sp. 05-339-2]